MGMESLRTIQIKIDERESGRGNGSDYWVLAWMMDGSAWQAPSPTEEDLGNTLKQGDRKQSLEKTNKSEQRGRRKTSKCLPKNPREVEV